MKLVEHLFKWVYDKIKLELDKQNTEIKHIKDVVIQLTGGINEIIDKTDMLDSSLKEILKRSENNDRHQEVLAKINISQEHMQKIKDGLDQHIDALAWETCSRLDIVKEKIRIDSIWANNVTDAIRLQISLGRESAGRQEMFGLNDKQVINVSEEKRKRRLKILEKINRGEKLRICLFIDSVAQWDLKNLYYKLLNSKYFKPYVVVIPNPDQGYEEMVKEAEHTYNFMIDEGYCTIKTYIPEVDAYLDLKERLDPDIIIYGRYWIKHFCPNYYINNFLDRLTFLIPYGFDVVQIDNENLCSFELCRRVDRVFTFTPLHKEINSSGDSGSNLYVTGSPKIDVLFDTQYIPCDIWKKQDKKKKRIIWAPHHSINMPETYYQFDSFFELYNIMIDIARKYQDVMQFAFRPHPMLRHKLETLWGLERTAAYYCLWERMENGQYSQDEYFDLFLTSDAMILDSCSFIAEYSAVNKPMFFTVGKTTRIKLNAFGRKAFETLYCPENDLKSEIEKFLDEIVLRCNDYLIDKRINFINEYLRPLGGKTAVDNIYDSILEEIWQGKDGNEKI